MRKTVPSHVLAELTPNSAVTSSAGPDARPSRRKRAVSPSGLQSPTAASPALTVFDRLAQALQPALDDVDTAWI
ncbi:MAG TPA: hypothetical protein VNO21_24910 [Polyangiaceae bacterium]|nr:hypothetical protein [Polyangiaceae bacterium]